MPTSSGVRETKMGPAIRRVWRANFHEEMEQMIGSAVRYPYAAFDTEFPGFLKKTPRHALEAERYRDMKLNVDSMKIIQVGITLFDHVGNSASWEFNFCGFDERRDPHSSDSVNLLKQHGVDLDKNLREGIDSKEFAFLVNNHLLHPNHNLQFVCFHGLYDIGYLMKLLNGGRPLPNTAWEFWTISMHRLRFIYDTKYMAGQCLGATVGEYGLERLGKVLEVERQGTQHHAGSDSLLIASVFLKLNKEHSQFNGILYGFTVTCWRKKMDDLKRRSYWAIGPSY